MARKEIILFLVLSIPWSLGCNEDNNSPQSSSADNAKSTGGDSDTKTTQTPDGFNSERLFANLETLASDEMKGRDEGTPESQAARAVIMDQLSSCGVAPLKTETYEQSVEGSPCVNILAKVEGADPTLSGRNVLLSAHYDHLGFSGNQIFNGAYDNAAAVASVLEVACIFSETPPSRSVVFGFWDCEEPPTFLTSQMGSEYFAENPPIDLDTIDVSIVLDLWGSALWPGFNGIFVLGAEASDVIKDTIFSLPSPQPNLDINIMSLHLIEEQPMGHQSWSDYDGFRDRKIPFLFLSDGQNKHYHQSTDTMDNIDEDKLIAESVYLLTLVTEIGENTQTPTWQGHPHLGVHDVQGLIEFGKVALGETEVPSMVGALNLGANSVNKINADIAALTKIQTKSDQNLTAQHLALMRRFTQRLMCIAGSTYPQGLCLAL